MTTQVAHGHQLTTLELARLLSRAARLASSDDDGATAVLHTLHDTESWLCRLREDDDGLTVETPYEQQPSLFDGLGVLQDGSTPERMR